MWNKLLSRLGLTKTKLEPLLLAQLQRLDISHRPIWQHRDSKPSINFRDELSHLRAGLMTSLLARKYGWRFTTVTQQTTIEITAERRGCTAFTVSLSYWDIDACIQASNQVVGINVDQTLWLADEIIAATLTYTPRSN